MATTTAQKLTYAASKLFRKQGYAATGIGEILTEAGVPKGSLYHHFPGGKEDLALAAAKLAGDHLAEVMERAFEGAPDFATGVDVLASAIGEIFDRGGAWQCCPVSATLLDGPRTLRFQAAAVEIFNKWQRLGAAHGRRLGLSNGVADLTSRKVLLLLEGAWILARAEGRSDPIRQLRAML